MSDAQSGTTDAERGSKPDQEKPFRRRLDAGGFSSAYADPEGMVCIVLRPWAESEPERLKMTPGQAMGLIQKLADATQRALKGHVA